MEKKTAWEKFENELKDLGLTAGPEQKSRLLSYYDFLVEKNRVMNLTAITEFGDVLTKHYLDSLLIVQAVSMTDVRSVIDVGTGAGFPGIPLKILFPKIRVTLLDSLKKRTVFLEECVNALGLKDVCVLCARAEDAARQEAHREKYDLAVSRAVSDLSPLCEYCLPFVRTGGLFAAYKSGHIRDEVHNAGNAVTILGGDPCRIVPARLPGSDAQRSFVVIKKVSNTPGKYPRRAGMPAKRPL